MRVASSGRRVTWCRPRGRTMGVPETGSGIDERVEVEDLADELARDDLVRRAARDEPAAAQREQVVGVAGGEVQVVQHHDDRGAALAVEVGEQVEHLDLVARRRGRSSARRAAGCRSPGRAPSRSRPAGAGRRTARRPARSARSAMPVASSACATTVVVVLRSTAPAASGAGAARGRRGRRRRCPRARSGSAAAGRGCARPPWWGGRAAPCRRAHLPGARREQAREGAQQRGLAAAVGADDRGDAAGRDARSRSSTIVRSP